MDVERNDDDEAIGVRADNNAELLAALPAIAGTPLYDCTSAFMFAGNQSMAVARISNDAPVELLAHVVENARTQAPEMDAVVLTCHSPWPAADEHVEEKMTKLAVLFQMAGLGIKGVFHVGSDGWIRYLPSGEHDSGTLHEVEEVNEKLNEIQVVPNFDERADAEPLITDRPMRKFAPALVEEVMQCAMRGLALGGSPSEEEKVAERLGMAEQYDVTNLFERAVTVPFEELTDQEVARLLITMELTIFRDLAIVQFATSKEHADSMLKEHITSGLDTSDLDRNPDYLPSVGIGLRPDGERLRNVITLGRSLAGVTCTDGDVSRPSTWAIQPLTVAGWAAWALGQSSWAANLLERALQIAAKSNEAGAEAGLGYTRTLRQVIGTGHLPPWSYDREL